LRYLRIIEKAARKEEDEDKSDDELEDDGDEAENDDAINRRDDSIEGRLPAKKPECQFSFHFKDIENTIRQFDESTGLSVQK